MSHFKRLITEQMGQAMGIAVGFADRILLTAVLFRLWETSIFEAWSACLALAGLVSLGEFGFNLYFNNRLMVEIERGQLVAAQRTYLLSNTIFSVGGIAGLSFIVFYLAFFDPHGKTINIDFPISAIVLSAGAALRIVLSGTYSLYRAHRQFARLTIIIASGDGLRIVAALLTCLFGAKLLAVSVVATLALTTVQFGFVIFDTRQRFPLYRFGFALPSITEMGQILTYSTAFFAQIVPTILLSTLPVLFLSNIALKTGLLAGFVLVRTLSGLPRTILQSFSIALGYECGRRLAAEDRPGALAVLSESSRLFATLSGIASGVLIGGGKEICYLWTGNSQLFNQDQLIVAVIPMVLAAMSVLFHNVLAGSNAPHLAACGRLIQLTITALIWWTLPMQDIALRMMFALSLGELLGYVPFAYYGVARLIPGAGLAFHVRAVLISLVASLIGMGAMMVAFELVTPSTSISRCIALLFALILSAVFIPGLGLSPRGRRALLDLFIRRTLNLDPSKPKA